MTAVIHNQLRQPFRYLNTNQNDAKRKASHVHVPVKLSLQDSSNLCRALHDTSLVVWLWSSRQVVSCNRKVTALKRF